MKPKNPACRAMERWRDENWPPKELQQYRGLPIYYGQHEAVFAFGQRLADAMALVSGHIADKRGYKPRWLRVPKLIFGVKRVSLAQATGKTSRRFASIEKLTAACGSFKPAAIEAMRSELARHPGHVLVAHKAISDMRAYIYTDREKEPKRERFMRTGLVLAVEDDFMFQNHTAEFRSQRCDAYIDPLAMNDEWSVFIKPALAKRSAKAERS